MEKNKVIVIMGVSGSGKSTIGKLLASAMEIPFYDGDDFHPTSNIEKMKNGIPLNDHDRRPWLETLAASINTWNQADGAVLACSSLKESYRKILSEHSEVTWVFLSGSYKTIFERMKNRKHFMEPSMLQSQFDALEAPEDALYVDIRKSPKKIIESIRKHLQHD